MTGISLTQTSGPRLPSDSPDQAPGGPASEAHLLAGLRAGDEGAYALLVNQFGARLLAVARRFLSSPEDSADAVQDALLAAFRYLDSFQGNSKLGTWLQRILINVCLTKRRARARRRMACLDHHQLRTLEESGRSAARAGPQTASAHGRLTAAETRAQVRACIDSLPESYRTVLVLRHIDELDTRTTARVLCTSPEVVRVRLHRARQALRVVLTPLVQAEETDGRATPATRGIRQGEASERAEASFLRRLTSAG